MTLSPASRIRSRRERLATLFNTYERISRQAAFFSTTQTTDFRLLIHPDHVLTPIRPNADRRYVIRSRPLGLLPVRATRAWRTSSAEETSSHQQARASGRDPRLRHPW